MWGLCVTEWGRNGGRRKRRGCGWSRVGKGKDGDKIKMVFREISRKGDAATQPASVFKTGAQPSALLWCTEGMGCGGSEVRLLGQWL